MTGEQINLIKKSFEKLTPIAPQAAALFYAKLFDLEPRLRKLFKGDMKEQGQKLMQVIATAVENLDRLDKFLPELRALGARHVAYGVEERDYETVGAVLIWTFEKALREDFDAPTKEAWTTVYNLLAETMKSGAPKRSKETAVVRP